MALVQTAGYTAILVIDAILDNAHPVLLTYQNIWVVATFIVGELCIETSFHTYSTNIMALWLPKWHFEFDR